MTSISKSTEKDHKLLADIGRQSFIESHGNSASEAKINKYVSEKYNYDSFKEELRNPGNIFHIIYHGNEPAGYSKIILNSSYPDIELENITKLEKLYLLKEFYGSKTGLELFNFNLELSQKNNQNGMWLFVWKENNRAVNFYKKAGFEIIGSYDFKLTDNHSNPNHQMLKKY